MLHVIAPFFLMCSVSIFLDDYSLDDIRTILTSPDKSVNTKLKAFESLRRMDRATVPANLFETVEGFTNNSDSNLRIAAVRSLDFFGKRSVPTLVRLLNHDHDGTHYYATLTLAKLKVDAAPAVPIMIHYLDGIVMSMQKNKLISSSVRTRTLNTINALKEIDAESMLVVKPGNAWIKKNIETIRMNWSDDVIRKSTGLAFQYIQRAKSEAKGSVPILIEFIQTVSPKSHGSLKEAIKCLGEIGPDASSALPVLRELLKNHTVGEEAEKAIASISMKTGQPK